MEDTGENVNPDQEEIVWWLVAFTCAFQTLHGLSSRAIQWLLKFLGALLTLMGSYSEKIAGISVAFPSSIYQRSRYLHNKIATPSVHTKVVCNKCHP